MRVLYTNTRMSLYGHGGRMATAPRRVTYMPPLSGFETHHGLMPKKCLSLWQKNKMHTSVYVSYYNVVSVLRVR